MHFQCQFNIRVALPVPQIAGGSEVTASSGRAFKIDGSGSIDMSVPAGKRGALQYKWSCKVTGTSSSTFCQRNLGTDPFVTIPSLYALDGSTYTFTLSVKTSFTDWQSTQQIIHFKQGSAVIEIKCLKNCLPAVMKTNGKEALVLEASCVANCKKIEPDMYEWTVDDPSFDYASNTRDGRNSKNFLYQGECSHRGQDVQNKRCTESIYVINVNVGRRNYDSVLLLARPTNNGVEVVDLYSLWGPLASHDSGCLINVPLDNADRARQVSAIAEKIVDRHISKPDPDIAALGTSLCKESAKVDERRLKLERFPQSFSEEVRDSTKSLSKCSQASVNPNLEIMKTADIPEPSTPFPVLDVPVITENYPDYIDDQNISAYQKNFDIASNNLVDICFLNGKTLQMIMVSEDDAQSIKSDSYNVTVVKEIGEHVPKLTIESQGVTLTPSKDFAKYRFEMMISMCTSTKNPFWWIQKEEIPTSVAIVNFDVKGKTVRSFRQPFVIVFDIQSSSTFSKEVHEGTTPQKPKGTLPRPEYDFETISMHRIDVNRSEGFTVEFSELNDNVLDFVDKDVYFLADVPSHFRFGYLIIVKTANKINAGTTSNVVAKLYGKKSQSEEHVLNYPDPEKKLLQKNQEDWFFMATERYLGDIEKIDLWFDSIGCRPTWYCSTIEIFDVQENKYWLILINKRFEILDKEQVVYTGFPEDPTEEASMKKKFSFKKISSAFHGPHMWNIITYYFVIIIMTLYCQSKGKASIISIKHAIIHFRCILIFNIILTMTILIVFGFWVPHITGMLWLTSVIVSLLVYIFLLENLTRFVHNFAVKQKQRVDYISGQVKTAVVKAESQRSMLYKKFGRNVLRPFLNHLYTPMDDDEIKERKYWAQTKYRVLEILEDLIMITIYVVLLYLVILKDKHPHAYLSHVEIEDMFKGVHARSVELEEIQLRRDNPEKRHFSEGWKDNKYSNRFARMDKVWKYTENLEAGTLGFMDSLENSAFLQTTEYLVNIFISILGKFSYYPGGGYIATLGRTMKNSIINKKYLFRNRWIDDLSRCVFIEFLLYSPNSNIFNSVTIWFEISTTGYIRSRLYVHTAKLLFVREEASIMAVVIFLSFLTMVVILTSKILYKIVRKKKLVFKDTWHVVDMVIILMSVSCLFLYAERSELVKQFLSKIEKSQHNEFINYFHLLYAETTLTVLAAVLVFIATLRLWKLLRFMVIIKVVEKTLILAAVPILCLFLRHIIIILCFMVTGVLLFGDQSDDFQTLLDAFETLLLLSVNFMSDFNLDVVNHGLAYFYYSAFTVLMLVYITLYVTVITIFYAEAQVYYSNLEGYTVKDYVKEQYDYYTELGRVRWKSTRLRAGSNEARQDVYPKADEQRYADCLTVPSNRMRGMGLVARCVVRNANKRKVNAAVITNEDADVIKRTIVNLFRSNSNKIEIFFMGNDENDKVKLVDDMTLLRMEKVVKALLKKGEGDADSAKVKELYKKLMERQAKEINVILESLGVILDTLNKINFDVDVE
ncbi:hypothetical protein NQ318_018465 [Aromia moschata]|uniref:PLAT domain-containing protein n=1 Tax=Aromia moschata TaxID=1265417 RepID=A0AAV8YLJ5_9CUCU|nr:hypothetical protein NQ318_018465 [Aromia moschata]